jgi:hypothetical protein
MLRLLGLASALLIFALAGFGGRASVASAGATDLFISQACVGGSLNVTFTWTGSDPRAQAQWLDLTTADNEWQAGTFVTSSTLPASQTAFTWNGVAGGLPQWVRISQRLADGTLDPGGTYGFVGLPCGGAPALNQLPATPTPGPSLPGGTPVPPQPKGR